MTVGVIAPILALKPATDRVRRLYVFSIERPLRLSLPGGLLGLACNMPNREWDRKQRDDVLRGVVIGVRLVSKIEGYGRLANQAERRGRRGKSATTAPAPARYSQISAVLRQRIISGDHFKDGQLPGDLSLMEEFGVSRQTIRAALHSLVIDGLIVRHRGLGTTIAKRAKLPDAWAIQSLEDLIGEFTGSTVVSAGPVLARNHRDVAKVFNLKSDESLFRLVRVLRSERGAWAYSTIYTRLEYGENIPPELLGTRAFILLIEEFCGVSATRVRQAVTAKAPPRSAQRSLGMDASSPALVVRRLFLSRSGEPVSHAEMFCRPDRYDQIVEFSRESPAPHGQESDAPD